MMSRAFLGIHPMTVYDLNDGCFVLIMPPFHPTAERTVLDALKLSEETLCFMTANMMSDRGTDSIELTESLACMSVFIRHHLAIKSKSALRTHVRGREWVTNRATDHRACLRKGVDYHGVRISLATLNE